MFKKTIIVVSIVLVSFFAISIVLSHSFSQDKVRVTIKEDYLQEYNDKQFTLDDFEWENARLIIYSNPSLIGDENSDLMYIDVYLNKSGLIQVIGAIWNFKKLEFVEDADFTKDFNDNY